MPNQRDVARLAGVSSASVSRYVTSPEIVQPATAQRIEEAILKSGYKVDHSARSLRTGRSFHVGILLPGIGPFYWEILQGIQNTLSQSGYFNSIFYTQDIDSSVQNTQKNLSSFLNNKMIEGIIFFPLKTPGDQEMLAKLCRLHENMVVVDHNINDPWLNQVFIDNYQAGWTAAESLLAEGHDDLLFLHGMETSYAAVKRYEGFADALRSTGIRLDEGRILHGDYTSRTAFELTKERLPSLPHFTGVFAVNDSSAIGFLRAAQEFGLDCPKDFSLIGFDNNQEFTPYMTPSLTTFQQPLGDMGQIAANQLLMQINGGTTPSLTILQPRFIRRESLASR